MVFSHRDMAEALFVIAEAGMAGMTYHGAVNAEVGRIYASNRMRYSLRPARVFSSAEFREIIGLAARERFVEAGEDTETLKAGGYEIDPWVLRLTLKGHDFAKHHGTPTLNAWAARIGDNIPVVVLNGVIAVLVALIVERWS